jgi:hypothetical protein
MLSLLLLFGVKFIVVTVDNVLDVLSILSFTSNLRSSPLDGDETLSSSNFGGQLDLLMREDMHE